MTISMKRRARRTFQPRAFPLSISFPLQISLPPPSLKFSFFIQNSICKSRSYLTKWRERECVCVYRCACVCVCVWERERKRERERKEDSGHYSSSYSLVCDKLWIMMMKILHVNTGKYESDRRVTKKTHTKKEWERKRINAHKKKQSKEEKSLDTFCVCVCFRVS